MSSPVSDANVVSKHVRVLVLGAGFSGLSCAHHLLTHKIVESQDLLVLEGRARLGGRVCSTMLDGNQVELGGAWLHGWKENALLNLQAPLGTQVCSCLLLVQFRRYSHISHLVSWVPWRFIHQWCELCTFSTKRAKIGLGSFSMSKICFSSFTKSSNSRLAL